MKSDEWRLNHDGRTRPEVAQSQTKDDTVEYIVTAEYIVIATDQHVKCFRVLDTIEYKSDNLKKTNKQRPPTWQQHNFIQMFVKCNMEMTCRGKTTPFREYPSA